MQVYPFLISCNNNLDYRVIVSPAFITKGGANRLLLQEATHKQTNQEQCFICEEVNDVKTGLKFTVVFWVRELTKQNLESQPENVYQEKNQENSNVESTENKLELENASENNQPESIENKKQENTQLDSKKSDQKVTSVDNNPEIENTDQEISTQDNNPEIETKVQKVTSVDNNPEMENTDQKVTIQDSESEVKESNQEQSPEDIKSEEETEIRESEQDKTLKEVIKDRWGRTIYLIEGIVIEGLKAREFQNKTIDKKFFEQVHQQLLVSHRQFWEITKSDFMAYESQSLNLTLLSSQDSNQSLKIEVNNSINNQPEKTTLKQTNQQPTSKIHHQSGNPQPKVTNTSTQSVELIHTDFLLKPICSIAFYPKDYEYLLVFTEVQEVRRYNMKTKWGLNLQKSQNFQLQGSLAFSPSGEIFAISQVELNYSPLSISAYPKKVKIQICQSKTHQVIRELVSDYKRNKRILIAFSPDSKTLIQSQDKSLLLWNINQSKIYASLKAYNSEIQSLAVSQTTNPIIAIGDQKGFIKLWYLHNLKVISLPSIEHDYSVNSLAFSPDGEILVSGSHDGEIKIWNIPNGDLIKRIKAHTKSVNALCFTPNGTIIASCSDDCTIKLWDMKTKKEITTITEHKYPVTSIAFSGDGRTLASGDRGVKNSSLKIWNLLI